MACRHLTLAEWTGLDLYRNTGVRRVFQAIKESGAQVVFEGNNRVVQLAGTEAAKNSIRDEAKKCR